MVPVPHSAIQPASCVWLTVEADVREAHRIEAAVTVVRDNGDRDAATAPAAG